MYAELGLPDSDELFVKAKLASAIQDLIEARHLTQVQAAELLRIDQPKVSKIIRGKLGEFSTEWLMHCLMHLGSDIEILVHKPSGPVTRDGSLKVALL
ncbi:MAG TPA: helix-turn-helix transcriptional regulator [Fimbriimonadaceae bacterium]